MKENKKHKTSIENLQQAHDTWAAFYAKQDNIGKTLAPKNNSYTLHSTEPKDFESNQSEYEKSAKKLQQLWRNKQQAQGKKAFIKVNPNGQHSELFDYFLNKNEKIEKSLNKNKLDILKIALDKGNVDALIFKDEYLPQLAMSLFASDKISYQQITTILERWQLQQEQQILAIYRIIDDNGEFTSAAEVYLIPALRFNLNLPIPTDKQLKSFRLLITTLPLSEQYFSIHNLKSNWQFTLTTLGYQLHKLGSILTNYQENKVIALSGGAKDAYGIAMYGRQRFNNAMIRIGAQKIEDIEAASDQRIRPKAIRYPNTVPFTNIHDYKQPPYFEASAHDDYHSLIASVNDTFRPALSKMTNILREAILLIKSKYSSKNSKETWEWIDNDYPIYFWHQKTGKLNIETTESMTESFCALLMHGGSETTLFSFLFYKNILSTAGMLILFDMAQNKNEWLKINIDPGFLIGPIKAAYETLKSMPDRVLQDKQCDIRIKIIKITLFFELKRLRLDAYFDTFLDFIDENSDELIKRSGFKKVIKKFSSKENPRNTVYFQLDGRRVNESIALRILTPEIKKKDIEKLRDIVDKEIGKLFSANSLLSNGLKENDFNKVKKALVDGADVNDLLDKNEVPLLYSIQSCDDSITKLLIDNEAMVNKPNKTLTFPLALAIKLNKVKITEYLLKKGALVNHYYSENRNNVDTPLTTAIKNNPNTKVLDMVKLLISYHTNPNDFGNGLPPLHWAILYHRYDIIRFLIEKEKVDINKCSFSNKLLHSKTMHEGITALYLAINQNDLALMGYLIRFGADIEKPTLKFKHTPLLYAIIYDNTLAAEILIKKSANVNARDRHDYSALYNAIHRNNFRIASLLIERKAVIDVRVMNLIKTKIGDNKDNRKILLALEKLLDSIADDTNVSRLKQKINKAKKNVAYLEGYLIKNVYHHKNKPNYIYDLFDSITRSPLQQKKIAPRPFPKKAYTVDASGMQHRNTKPPQFSAAKKQGYSPLQSTSMVGKNYKTAVFKGEKYTKNTREVNVGIRIALKDARLGRLYVKDSDSYRRPHDQNSFAAAKAFVEKINDPQNPQLFSDKLAFEQALRNRQHRIADAKNQHNEALARLKWNTDGSSYICIFSDNLESRLLAQEYAQILYLRLQQQAKELGISLPKDYYPPICFYLPGDSKHEKLYTRQQQKQDITSALSESCKPGFFNDLKNNERYELLLVNDRFGSEITRKVSGNYALMPPKLLLLEIIQQGYTQIAQALARKDKRNRLSGLKINRQYIDMKDKKGKTAIYHVVYADAEKLLVWLLNNKANVNIVYGDNKQNLLHIAAQRGSVKTLKILLESRLLDITSQDGNGCTALHYAAMWGHTEVVILLSQYHSYSKNDINQADQNGCTALEYAVMQQQIHVVKQLLTYPDIEANLINNTTHFRPLYYAVYHNNIPMIELLLKAGVDVNATNDDGNTALHFASIFGLDDAIKCLLTHGANFFQTNDGGKAALDVAKNTQTKQTLLFSKKISSFHQLSIFATESNRAQREKIESCIEEAGKNITHC